MVYKEKGSSNGGFFRMGSNRTPNPGLVGVTPTKTATVMAQLTRINGMN